MVPRLPQNKRGPLPGSKKPAYTAAFKREVITYYEKNRRNTSLEGVASHFKIPIATAKTIYRRRDVVPHRTQQKTASQMSFSRTGKTVGTFISLARSARVPVTGAAVIAKPQMLRAKLQISDKSFQIKAMVG